MWPFLREWNMTPLSVKKTSSLTSAPRHLPQLVPSSACFRCEICCRFPDPDSALRPYFTGEEINAAVDRGLEARVFPDPHGCQVTLVPDEHGEGFHCPAFQSQNGSCRIYEQRPLDCQLYPLALMWSAAHEEVVLGWDAKCPFMHEQVPDSIRGHADRVMQILGQPVTMAQIADHPRLVGRFQDDVVVLARLPEITQALFARWGSPPLHRLMLGDLPRLTAALDRSARPGSGTLAAFSAPYHYIWNGLLPYSWMELRGALCLFVQSPDGWFMPLPPLTEGAIDEPLTWAFQLMRRWNHRRAVSRVENIPASMAPPLASMGYLVTPKDYDYLYKAADLVSLAGDRYKPQRALCNRVEREGGVAIEPYQARDRLACRAMLQEWRRQKRETRPDSFGESLLDDSVSAHEAVWSHASDLQLSGSVARVNGKVRGYTFGYWLEKQTWCVLLEVADRTISGLAQYLFRDTCRKALAGGAEFINTMDDSGLPGLRLSKEAYHPVAHGRSFICSEVLEP
jgi:uncharacterized protein